MKLAFFKVCGRSALLMTEVMAVIVGLSVITCGLLMWRLMSSPLDIGFARDYVEEALKESESGYSAVIEGASLYWPRINGPLVLRVENADLRRGENSFLKLAAFDMGIAVRPLFFGHLRPVSLSLQEPSLRIYRSPENKFQLTLDGETPVEHAQGDESVFDLVLGALSREDSDRRKWGPLALLRSFEIKGARMVVEDHMLGVTWHISPMDLSFARDRDGLAISSTLQLPGGVNRSSLIVFDAIYNPKLSDLVLNVHLQDIDPRALAHKVDELSWFRDQSIIVNGDLTLVADPQGKLRRVGMNLVSKDGSLNIPEAYNVPVGYDEIAMKAEYDHEKGVLSIDNLALSVNDLEISASTVMAVTPDRIFMPLKVSIPSLTMDTLVSLWPTTLADTSAHSWFTERLSEGRLHDGVLSVDLEALRSSGKMGQESMWDVSARNLVADARMENMKVDYNKPMIHVADAKASAHIENDIMTITMEGGTIDDLAIQEGQVIITELTSDKVGQAEIKAKLKGPVRSVLRYIQTEPIAFEAEAAGIQTEKVKGDAVLDVDVSFPTLRDLPAEQVKAEAKAEADGLLIPGLIKGLDVSGDKMQVHVKDNAVTIKGPAKLQGRAAQLDFDAYLVTEGKPYVFRAKTSLVADYDLRSHFGAGLEDWVVGDPLINVVYTEFKGGKAQVDIDGKVDDVVLLVKPFKYEKTVGISGTASAQVLLDKGDLKEVKDLTIATPDLKVEKGSLVFETVKGQAELRRGKLPRARLHETDVALDFEQVPSGPLKLKASGAFFDARAFLGKDKKDAEEELYTGPAVIADLNVTRMRTHQSRMIDKTKLLLDMNSKGDINRFEMDATAGKGPLTVRLKPAQNGKMAVYLEAQDAGAVLRAFDVYDNVQGGVMKIYGEQVPENNNRRRLLRGSGEITDFRVVKAPVLAQLVGALSLTGIPELLSGQGIYFSRLQSDFDWVISRGGDAYYMRNGRTSGSSIGLTFEGKVDKKDDVMDLGGTVVPVTFVNDFISNIPLIGTLLTGGEGALIAATYSVRGPVKTPTVTVNPLAALTPGILRRIFFEEEKVDRAPDSMGPPAPTRQPTAPQQPTKKGYNR